MVRTGQPSDALVLLAAASLALAGCVAAIEQERIGGPARPAPNAQPVVVTERRSVADRGFAGHGKAGAPAPPEIVECRDVQVTAPMVRDIDIRRRFAVWLAPLTAASMPGGSRFVRVAM